MSYPTPEMSPLPYAGFWRRFAALWVDQIILLVVGVVLNFFIGMSLAVALMLAGTDAEVIKGICGLAGWILGLLEGWQYYAWMESSPL